MFGDPELHGFTDSAPPSRAELRARCARWVTGRSPDGRERWFNWLARLEGVVIGHFQASVRDDGVASLAYTVARPWQRRGLATEALRGVIDWLRGLRVTALEASIDPRNRASLALAERLGLRVVIDRRI